MSSVKQNFPRLFHPSAPTEEYINRLSIYLTIAIIFLVSILALFITDAVKQKIGVRMHSERSLHLSIPIQKVNTSQSDIVKTAYTDAIP